MRLTGAVLLIFLLASLPVFLLVRSREQIDLFGNIAQLTGLLFAGGSFLNAWDAAKNRAIQKAAILIASGMLIWAIGQMMVTYSELLLHRTPYGTVSSIFFVIGNSLCLIAMITLTKYSLQVIESETMERTIRLAWITASIVAVLLILADWRFLSDPERNPIWKVLDLLYPLFDISIIALTIVLMRAARLKNDPLALRGYACFFVAFMLIAVADFVGIDADFEKMVYRLIDTVYFSAYFFIALSAQFLVKTSRTPSVAKKEI